MYFLCKLRAHNFIGIHREHPRRRRLLNRPCALLRHAFPIVRDELLGKAPGNIECAVGAAGIHNEDGWDKRQRGQAGGQPVFLVEREDDGAEVVHKRVRIMRTCGQ